MWQLVYLWKLSQSGQYKEQEDDQNMPNGIMFTNMFYLFGDHSCMREKHVGF